MIRAEIKKHLKRDIIFLIIAIVLFVILLIIFKYEVEGEKKETLPFLIDKISVVSTADGLKNPENTEYLWSGQILQINDIYIKVSQNDNIKKVLKNVKIEDIQIEKQPLRGEINITRISKNEDTSNKYLEENLSEITYLGGKSTSLEELTIANQGGIIGLRTINKGLGKYNSNELEINYDGRLLNIENIKNEEIKFKIAFELVIEVLDGINYKTRIEIDLLEENIVEKGIAILELNDLQNLIYKRV